MTRHSIPIEQYLEAANVFGWASKAHYQMWFTGQANTRHRRSEVVLQKLVRHGKLASLQYGRKLIYSRKRVHDEILALPKVVHGLACTECLVRIFRSRMDGTVISESFFRGLGSIPEWGISYPNRTLLLFEYCTKSNFFHTGEIRGKLGAYRRHLSEIEQKFGATVVVLFVLDLKRESVERYITCGADLEGPFFFTDYETLLAVPIGKALDAPIYYWNDGQIYPLRRNV